MSIIKKILILPGKNPTTSRIDFLSNLSVYLSEEDYEVIEINDDTDLKNYLVSDMRIVSVIYDFESYNTGIAKTITNHNDLMPIFAIVHDNNDQLLDYKSVEYNLFFFEEKLDNEPECVGVINRQVKKYFDNLIPPFTTALMKYVQGTSYAFCTPGHLGGTAFLNSPVGSNFYDFFGPNIFKSDVSISMGALGSLLDHSGPHKDAEDYIKHHFGSDASFIVTNGTSTANKIVGMSSCTDGEVVIIDRNCHKSLTQLLMIVDVDPIYLKPTRNAYGILGGVPKSEFLKETLQQKMDDRNLKGEPIYMVLTNSTYDGLFYDVQWIANQEHLKTLHFDSAWVPYTPFHDIYKGLYGMGVTPSENQLIYETQSTHKLLAAFSQTSMIHAKGDFDFDRFNEVYAMHTTTSPFYPIVASAEIATAMMNGNAGKQLIQNSIDKAIIFREEISKLYKERTKAGDWFYNAWQPEKIGHTPECYPLHPKDKWHGFSHVDEDFMYLDPIKITLTTPGLSIDGEFTDIGIPAPIVAEYLGQKGIIVEKTGPYNMLFLFSIGVSEGKSMALLNELVSFKKAYDNNELVKDVLPNIFNQDPIFYRSMTIQDLCRGIHNLYIKYDLPKLMFHAYDILPEYEISPHKAFQKHMRGEIEEIKIQDIKGHTAAEMILPYPPGVPLIMPGEKITDKSEVIADFLIMLCNVGSEYPGFETDIHGVSFNEETKEYTLKILKE